jgi:putative membrane protein
MNRRHMLKTTVAMATLPTMMAASAFAQDGNIDAEKKHAAETKKVGTLSLATSRIAQKTATNPMLKAFAGWEVAEQETIADILKSMESGGKAEGALKPPSDAEVNEMLDADGRAMLEKLKSATGADFDGAYLVAQLDGHKKLLAIQEEYLKVGKNREHLNVTKLARGQIKEHIDHLEMMQAAK